MAKSERQIVGDWVRIAVDEETRKKARRLAALCGVPLHAVVKMALEQTLQTFERAEAEFVAGR